MSRKKKLENTVFSGKSTTKRQQTTAKTRPSSCQPLRRRLRHRLLATAQSLRDQGICSGARFRSTQTFFEAPEKRTDKDTPGPFRPAAGRPVPRLADGPFPAQLADSPKTRLRTGLGIGTYSIWVQLRAAVDFTDHSYAIASQTACRAITLSALGLCEV